MATSTGTTDAVRVLARALDQAADVLDHVHADRVGDPTPCEDWDVGALADHLVQTRGGAFGPEVEVAGGATPYDALAAFAGRRVPSS